jgi:tetratricopeptide (TPR) repeat protein
MLKANFKSVFFITLVSTLVFLSGCSSPEEKKAASVQKALSLAEAGDSGQALKILETLATEYPNDIVILESMGRVYSAEGDATMAAFFLEQAYLQAPEDTERLFQAYQSLEAAKQPAGHLLEKLATLAPKSMSPELWVRLGQIHQSENKVEAALEAYLKGVNPDTSRPAPETAAAIGQLFVKSGNLPQAENWLEIAADHDDPNALTALFGLLEVNLRQKDWPGAEAIVQRLEKQFPGAIEASQWQQAQQELVRWRKAQNEMKDELARAEAEKKAAAEKAATEAEAAEAGSTAETESSSSGSIEGETRTAATEGKAQIIADLEAAESMADTPAVETETPEAGLVPVEDSAEPETGEEESSKAITFDPSIAIEPADPEITFTVDYDQASVAGEASYTVETPANMEPELPTEVLTDTALESPLESIRADERPRSIEELLADAETAELDRDFKSAIRKYWAAISIANNRAEIWNLLSRAYLIDGQLNNAETTALEAVRLEPREVAYTLDYLRVAQRTKATDSFLRELETAYARFPGSPEITLSLARAHERISRQNETARNLYLRFIDIAPNHPLVPEARAAAAALRTE